MWNPIVEIRWFYDRLISTMGFPIPVRQHLYIELGPWMLLPYRITHRNTHLPQISHNSYRHIHVVKLFKNLFQSMACTITITLSLCCVIWLRLHHSHCPVSLVVADGLGADSITRCHLTSIGNPIVEIRRSYDRLISTMGFPILVRWHLVIESGPRGPSQ